MAQRARRSSGRVGSSGTSSGSARAEQASQELDEIARPLHHEVGGLSDLDRAGLSLETERLAAFILDLEERLRALPYAVTWAYWPPTAPFDTLVREARCLPQEGGDLGERMARAIASSSALLAVGAAGAAVAISFNLPFLRSCPPLRC